LIREVENSTCLNIALRYNVYLEEAILGLPAAKLVLKDEENIILTLPYPISISSIACCPFYIYQRAQKWKQWLPES
jgi:hypothetical protein